MVRHVPWDELPYYYAPNRHDLKRKKIVEEQHVPVVEHQQSLQEDLKEIAIKTSFGAILGGICGGVIKTVEVMRDVKAMAADKKKTTMSIVRFTAQLGGIFGAYQGIRKTMEICVKQQAWEDNIFFSSILTISPLIAMPKYRPLIPYTLVLICLDTFNEFQDTNKK